MVRQPLVPGSLPLHQHDQDVHQFTLKGLESVVFVFIQNCNLFHLKMNNISSTKQHVYLCYGRYKYFFFQSKNFEM